MKRNRQKAPLDGVKAGARAKALRAGGYSALLVAVLVAIAVVLNLIVGALPAGWTQFDLTAAGLYSLSDQTKELVGALDADVEVYLLARRGQEDERLVKLLDQYAALSNHLKVSAKDPVVYPNFAAQYTDESIQENSVLVVSGDRSRYVSYYDIYEMSYNADYSVNTEFAGEGSLTSAIGYVTSEDLPVVYPLTGHGEADLPTALATAIAGQNIEVGEALNLVSADAVPADAAAVLLYGPQSDLTAGDAEKLKAYLDGGGKLLVFTDDTGAAMPNLESVTGAFGLKAVQGLVCDPDAQHNVGYPHYLLPDLGAHAITTPLKTGGYYVLAPLAHGIDLSGAEELTEVSATALLTTSASAYNKADGFASQTVEQEDGDAVGAYALAAAAEKGDSKLVWVGGTSLFDSQIDAMVSGANTDFFLNALGWACEQEQTVSIHAKSLSYESLTIPTGTRNLLTMLMVAVLPLAFVLAGVLVWNRRRVR